MCVGRDAYLANSAVGRKFVSGVEGADSCSRNGAIVFKKPSADEFHIADVKRVNGGTFPE